MYTIDERIKSLPVTKEQVLAVYHSLNQPHLAVPGRKAGPAQAFVVALQGPTGYGIFIYLYLPNTDECATYVSDRRSFPPDQYAQEEAEAMAFMESMGFMVDNLNFHALPPAEQERLLKTLPVFLRERPRPQPAPQPRFSAPPASGGPPVAAAGMTSPQVAQALAAHGLVPQQAAPAPVAEAVPQRPVDVVALGKLLGSFALLVFVLGCKHVPSAKDQEAASIHYDLGVQALQQNTRQALAEFDLALQLDPELPEALAAKGMLLHVAFGKPEEALPLLKQAIALRPTFSEAKTNLGNVYLDLKRYDEAVKMYQDVLVDIRYPTPYIAQSNLGWARYKLGQTDAAVADIRMALTNNPKFCLGYRNLGTIYEETGQVEDACRQFAKFREYCPQVPEAYLREGTCQAKLGQVAEAKASFQACAEKAQEPMKGDCQKLREQLGP